MTETSDDAEALAALKSRRGRSKRPSAFATPAPETPESHSTLRAAMTRQHPILFDPTEKPIVVEVGGHVPPAVLDDLYVVAQVDGHEQVVPPGCTTPIMRQIWSAGNHVRKDVYATYLNVLEAQGVSPGEAVSTTAPAPPHMEPAALPAAVNPDQTTSGLPAPQTSAVISQPPGPALD